MRPSPACKPHACAIRAALLCLAFASGGFGCGPMLGAPEPRARKRTTAAAELASHVVVRGDQPLYATPGGTAVTRLPWRKAWAKRPVVFRLLDQKPGWVAIAPPLQGDETNLCTLRPWALRQLDVRFWVPESALGTVTTSPQIARFRDQTSTRVAAGVDVSLEKEVGRGYGMYRVRADGLSFATLLRHDAVGAMFRPGPSMEASGTHYLKKGVEMLYGSTGKIGQTDRYVFLEALPLGPHAAGTRIRVSRRCVELEVVVDDQFLQEKASGGLGVLGALGAGKGSAWLPAGTPLRWPDGGLAGRVHARLAIRHEAVSPDDRWRCFRHPWFYVKPGQEPAEDAALTLCAEAEAFRESGTPGP